MRLGLSTVVCFFSFVWLSDCAPPTCYSRSLGLSKEVMTLLDKIHTYHRTVSVALLVMCRPENMPNCCCVSCILTVFVGLQKPCAEVLPAIFLDVHVSLILGHIGVLKGALCNFVMGL